jgi:N4-gp56 family major capsid protein
MNWATVVEVNTIAMEKRLRPIRSGGKGYYVLVIHPRQRRDLVTDPTYQTIVSRAERPGTKNPLFTGAMATVDNTVIHCHNKVFNTSGLASGSKWGSGGTVDGAQALLLGAQAGGIATVQDPFWRETTLTDYGNRPGIGVGRKIGMLKPQFLSVYDETNGPGTATRQDFGVVSLYTAAAA